MKILLFLAPVILLVIICFASQRYGFRIIPKEFTLPPPKPFKFPKVRNHGDGWVAEAPDSSSDDEFSSDEDEEYEYEEGLDTPDVWSMGY